MEKHGFYFAEVGLYADRLEAFGFRYKLADAAWQEHMTPLLKTFATQFPHEIMLENFVVPLTTLWPQNFWGFKLGKVVSWSSQFVWNHKQTRWEQRTLPQSTNRAGGYGYCRVPAGFKFPCELPWPKHMWGLRMRSFLGEVNESADLPLYDDLHRALLDEQEVGFVFELMKRHFPTAVQTFFWTAVGKCRLGHGEARILLCRSWALCRSTRGFRLPIQVSRRGMAGAYDTFAEDVCHAISS
uniref:Uncharacterized protein n=1 Tax=Hyaloperonospora arabidopsidis (strain Emoy2) TaxID=559515 RepID=M4BKE7_HYAAE